MYDRLKPYVPGIYFVFIAFILFANNGNVSLWDQDEAAYAGFAKEMVTSGDWSVPEFMWSEIHRKPPLHFWNIALSYKLFGINEFSVRFPSTLFVLLTYLLIYFAGAPLFGRKNAFLGTVVLSTTLFIPSLAKVSVTDSTLLFFSTLCAFSVLYILEKRSLRWSIIFWASFAFALLTKGPPIILFTGILTAILFLLHPKRRNLLVLHPWFFLPLACLPLFSWGYYVSKHDGGAFIQWMLDWYILKRVNGSVLGQTGPPGMHLVGLLLFFLPYFMFFPRAFWHAISGVFISRQNRVVHRDLAVNLDSPQHLAKASILNLTFPPDSGFFQYKRDKVSIFFLSAWFIAGWFLYEWTPSKLPAYVVAAHVPLALLVGRNLVECMETNMRPAKAWIIFHFVLMAILSLALLIIPLVIPSAPSMKLYFGIGGIIFLAIMALTFYNRRSEKFVPLLIGANLFFQAAVWLVLLPQADMLKNASKLVAEYVENNATNSSTILIGNNHGHPPSLPFYLGLNFKDVKEERDISTLMLWYESNHPCVLILNRQQRDSAFAIIPDVEFKEVSSMLTDRSQQVRYYIAINEAAYNQTTNNSSLVERNSRVGELEQAGIRLAQ